MLAASNIMHACIVCCGLDGLAINDRLASLLHSGFDGTGIVTN